MKRALQVCAVVVLAMTAVGLASAQSDPFVGTWKLDVAKSKFDPGPAPMSQSRTWHASGKVSVEGVGASGKPVAYAYTLKADSKEHEVTGAIANGADKVSTKKIDANTVEANFTRAGKHVETATFTASMGAKVLTIHAVGMTPDGKPFENMAVWSKQ